ncbi:MAG: hypothetical protein Q9218_007538 [Villophora microphyllina]
MHAPHPDKADLSLICRAVLVTCSPTVRTALQLRSTAVSEMDPLSISAAVVGLLTAGASVIGLVQNIMDLPKLEQGVVTEVRSITICLRSLQKFIDGTVTAPRSRTALIMIDEVRVVLTECVTLFSDLRKVLDELGLDQKRRALTVLKRSSDIKIVRNLLHRLQGSRVSLTLMLSTLSWDLRSLVLRVLDQNSDLAQKFDNEHLPRAPLLRSTPSMLPQDDDETIRAEPVPDHSDDLRRIIAEGPVDGSDFERALQGTRVYRRLAYRRSDLSLPSSAGRSRGWSFLSDVSLSEVTEVSVISLPLSVAELYEGSQHYFDFDTVEASLLPEGSIRIYATLAAQLWPPDRVALELRRTGLIECVVESICALAPSGYTILTKKRTDMAEYSSCPLRQKLFWKHMVHVRGQIRTELLSYHCPGSLHGVHEGLPDLAFASAPSRSQAHARTTTPEHEALLRPTIHVASLLALPPSFGANLAKN